MYRYRFFRSLMSPSSISFAYSYTLVINASQCGSATSSNFTVLVDTSRITGISASYLKTVANGGSINNTTTFNGQTVPADLVFSTLYTYGTYISGWDIESYNQVTGALTAWVTITTLSPTINTVFYMGIGCPSITTYQGGSVGSAWSSSYVGVWHFANGSTLSLVDSTSYGNTVSNSSSGATAGNTDGGISMTSAQSAYIPYSPNYDSTTGTWMIWFKTSASVGTSNTIQIVSRHQASSHYGISIALYKPSSIAQLIIQVYSSAFANYEADGSVALNDGNWHQVVFSFNGTNTAATYVDGVGIYSASPTSWSFTGGGSNEKIYLNNDIDTFWDSEAIVRDELQILNTNVNSSWVTTAYNNQKPGSTFITAGLTGNIITFIGGIGAGQTSGTGNVTTGSINMMGATLFVASVSSYSLTSLVGVSDSQGNTWTLVGSYINTSQSCYVAIYYCYSPSTSTSQTFSTTGGSGTYPAICVTAYSGTLGSGCDSFTGSVGGSAATITVGSVTPSVNGAIIITSIASNFIGSGYSGYNVNGINSQFSLTNYYYGGAVSAASFYNAQFWQIQPLSAACDPTITWNYNTGSGQGCGIIAVFH